MCGIVGIIGKGASGKIFDALLSLQHRGQDACGICLNGQIRRESGKLSSEMEEFCLQNMSNIGIGHVRYPTSGTYSLKESQPFKKGTVTLCHNGNIINPPLKYQKTQSDSETILLRLHYTFNHFHQKFSKKRAIIESVKVLMKELKGGYSIVAMIEDYLVVFRDPYGLRPLSYCYNNEVFCAASEPTAFNMLEDVQTVQDVTDVISGSLMIIDQNLNITVKQIEEPKLSPCIFEYVYLSRPDSVLNGINVYQARLKMGQLLAKQIIDKNIQDIDVVIPVPTTSCPAALALAETLDIPYREGFVKNVFIDRTFITANQQKRQQKIKRKLNPNRVIFQDKNVLIVDDSIVRGNTARAIIKLARDAGSKKVFFASCAPPIRYQNIYGIDIPTQKELIAFNRTEEEICQELGADRLIYQKLEDLIRAVESSEIKTFDCSVFNGEYVTGYPGTEYFEMLNQMRNDQSKILSTNSEAKPT